MTLKYVRTIKKPSGAEFTYLIAPGMKPIRLPDAPKDSAVFLGAYAAAMKMLSPSAKGTKPGTGTIAAALIAYQKSDVFLGLAEHTRANRRGILSKIADRWGGAKFADLRSKHIEGDLVGLKPFAAVNRLKAWRGFTAWAKDAKLVATDPAIDVAKPKAKTKDGHLPWDGSDIAAFRNYWGVGTPQRLAMELLYWTAARASDAVRLGPGMVDKQGWLSFRQKKTGGDVAIPFDRSLPRFAEHMQPDLTALHNCIAAAPRHMTWLVTAFGSARSEKAFSSWFAGAAKTAGLTGGKSAHGLRKARATALAEAGATAHQIAAWTGHETLSEVQRYARSANKRRILSDDTETVYHDARKSLN